MCRLTSCKHARDSAGFTLIEVVVTLAVIAAILLSIGSLVSVDVRSTRALDDHLVLVETARAIETELPDRNRLTVGTLSGERNDQLWRVDVQLFPGVLDAQASTPWVPLTASITVQTPRGTRFSITTVRLGRRPSG
ncbi:MAG: prepilin-type N-terminal cleavage/methylation domain-containing protein [Rhizobiales bacterium]|nr:prepilin-type N-terminal cleavage/methylation domain-containing protein [Hyphomicrobiales bacterium]